MTVVEKPKAAQAAPNANESAKQESGDSALTKQLADAIGFVAIFGAVLEILRMLLSIDTKQLRELAEAIEKTLKVLPNIGTIIMFLLGVLNNLLGQLPDVPKPEDKEPYEAYLRPVKITDHDPWMATFYANRDDGARVHGSRDFHVPVGTVVYAATDGYVRTYGKYYIGTWFMDVENNDGTWFRYAEIEGTVSGIAAKTTGIQTNLAIRIRRGDPIGVVIMNTNPAPYTDSMLHLEWYQDVCPNGAVPRTGDTGIYYFENWSNHGTNAVYDYVPKRNYKKRCDLEPIQQ